MNKKYTPWLFLAPVILSLVLLFGYPLIRSIFMAFQNYKLTAPNDVYFVGLDNFKKVFAAGELGLITNKSLLWVEFKASAAKTGRYFIHNCTFYY